VLRDWLLGELKDVEFPRSRACEIRRWTSLFGLRSTSGRSSPPPICTKPSTWTKGEWWVRWCPRQPSIKPKPGPCRHPHLGAVLSNL